MTSTELGKVFSFENEAYLLERKAEFEQEFLGTLYDEHNPLTFAQKQASLHAQINLLVDLITTSRNLKNVNGA